MVSGEFICAASLSLGFFLYAIALKHYVRSFIFGELGHIHIKMTKQSMELQYLIERNMNKINEIESLLKGFSKNDDNNGSSS